MNLDIKKDGDSKFICKLHGSIDTKSSKIIEKEIMEIINSSKNVCTIELDMEEAEYITSSFIRICISTKRHNKVESFSITNVSDEVLKIFKILNLVDKLDVS